MTETLTQSKRRFYILNNFPRSKSRANTHIFQATSWKDLEGPYLSEFSNLKGDMGVQIRSRQRIMLFLWLQILLLYVYIYKKIHLLF